MVAGCASAPYEMSGDVDINLETQRSGVTDITVAVRGDADGRTTLAVGDDFGFTQPDPQMFDDLRVSCAGNCRVRLNRQALVLDVSHPPGALIEVSHRLDRAAVLDDVDDYSAFADRSGVLLFSPISLFLPQGRRGDQDVTIRWSVPSGWRPFGPFGSAEVTRGRLTPIELSSLLLAAGPHTALGGERGDRFGVVSFDPQTADPQEIVTRMDPILETTRAFFPGTKESWYFVTAAEAGPEIQHGFSLGGTAVRSAFALYVSPGMDMDTFGGTLDRVVAHEYFHNWNGVLFFLDGGGEHHARWFVEGFTEFYARKIALESGASSLDDFVEHLNDHIRFYRQSDVQYYGLEEMVGLWEANDPRAELSYKRGDLLALYVDEAVRRVSGNRRSLDDMMRFFARRARLGMPDPTPDDVYRWIEQNASQQVMQRVRRVVEQGGPVPLPRQLTEPALVLSANGFYQQAR